MGVNGIGKLISSGANAVGAFSKSLRFRKTRLRLEAREIVMSSAHKATTGGCLTAKALATRMGISPKRLRAILRDERPGEAKAKAWDIPAALAKEVQRK